MKFAFLSTFYPFRGGIAQFNAALYRELEKKHTVKAFSFTTQYPDILFPGSSQFVTEKDIADKINAERVLSTVNPFTYLSAAQKIKKFAPNVLIMKFWIPFLAPSLGTVSMQIKKKAKIITILDNVIPHESRPGDIVMTKYFLNQNSGFVAMSDVVKNDLLCLKPDAKYIQHEHPLYDHFGKKISQQEARKKLNIPEGKKVILFFGFIRDYKGLDLLISAMKDTPDDYYLVIAGEVYGDFAKYQRLIDEQQLQNKIQANVRYIDDGEVPLFFSAADVCVLPYRSATQSGITSIAYHFDLPVIATDVGGLKESIHHNSTGFIIDTPSSEKIKQSMEKYFRENKKEEFTSNIMKLKHELSWEHLAKSIVEFSAEI